MDSELKKQSVLVLDIETDSLDEKTAELKWFGAYSYKIGKYFNLSFKEPNQIKKLLDQHKTLVGFNHVNFDNPIIERCLGVHLKYKNNIDLLDVCKKRLALMGIKPDDFKLQSINQTLELSQDKGDIDYNIFTKSEWGIEEKSEIIKYLKQDVEITRRLFEWFFEYFKPLRKHLSEEEKNKFVDVKASAASLAYRVVCRLANIEPEFESDETIISQKKESFSAGYHIMKHKGQCVGPLVYLDFVSAYPHALAQCNLFNPVDTGGWCGSGYFVLRGRYENTQQGKMEKALMKIFRERMKAKREKNKPKDKSYKVVINSLYGASGNPVFKQIYDPRTSSDTTNIVRTWLKKLAKHMENNGFIPIYGFTDGCYFKIPEGSSKEELLYTAQCWLEHSKQFLPFPEESFNLEVEDEVRLLWVLDKNRYLYVDYNDEVHCKATLLNKNVPKAVLRVFNEYISPKIKRDLEVNFTEVELRQELIRILKHNPEQACETYNVKPTHKYNESNSLHYQISSHYGAGKHFLIPNTKKIGPGKAKCYCSYEDFINNNLTHQDINISGLMKSLKPFITKSKDKKLK